MELDVFQIDAFSARPFAGNPAGVVPLQEWLPEATMQGIAAEMNLAETAFFAPEGKAGSGGFRIRWFTPTKEVKLCGHATLASGHVLMRDLRRELDRVEFQSLSGPLSVQKSGERLQLDFPLYATHPAPEALAKVAACFDVKPVEMHVCEDYDAYVALYEKAADVQRLVPDFIRLNALDRTMVVTARGDARGEDGGVDFVSRYFAPTAGIPEDPVTGSSHCVLAPFWSGILGKTAFHARQVSSRGGDLWLRITGDRLKIAGDSVCVLKGKLTL